MVSSEPTWHVSRVQKRVSKWVNFKVQKVQKPDLFYLMNNFLSSLALMPIFCHQQNPSAIHFIYPFTLAPCVTSFPLFTFPFSRHWCDDVCCVIWGTFCYCQTKSAVALLPSTLVVCTVQYSTVLRTWSRTEQRKWRELWTFEHDPLKTY